jgi:lipoprotein-anchoring transpeptidase ErfK/SrfK
LQATVRFLETSLMSRRLLLLLLVPALVGTMVGVGAATLSGPRKATAQLDNTPPSETVAAESFELGFPRTPSGLAETELAVADRSKRKAKLAAESEEKFTFDVAEVQEKLRDLRYYIGAIDGEAGAAFASSVMAFQKVQGIGADGSVGPQTLAALDKPKQPSLRGGAANRLEVDLTKQVMYVVEGGSLVRILPVSSGSGSTYSTASGGTARSLTPVGTYAVQRKISGIREAELGTLYDPMYFYQGWAIHGSNSVPAYPASHGCIRVTRADALWLFPRVPVGFQVKLYGGTHVFLAGSSAPGTSNPAGDTGSDAKPSEEPKPADKPKPSDPESEEPRPPRSPKPSPKPEPEPTDSEEPEPEPAPDEIPAPGARR